MRIGSEARTYAKMQGVPHDLTPEMIADMRALDFQAGVEYGKSVSSLMEKFRPTVEPKPIRNGRASVQVDMLALSSTDEPT
jgi:hypothetical protein